jgi:predicted nucleic acid-binding protein
MVDLRFIDSNILVFANVKNFPEYERALNVLEMGLKGQLKLCFNTIIALETHYKLLKLINIEEANYRVETLFKSKRIIYFDVLMNTLQKGFAIAKKEHIRTNDSVIVASMYEHNISKIYTDNETDFQKVKDIEIINPIR